MDVRVGPERRLSAKELMLLNCDVEKDWKVPWTARRSNQSILKKINPKYHWKDWCWSWSSNTLATWCKEPTHWKRHCCWERLKAGEGDKRGVDGWMASPIHHQHESEQTLGDGEGQGSLACCNPWGWTSRTPMSNWTIAPWKLLKHDMLL